MSEQSNNKATIIVVAVIVIALAIGGVVYSLSQNNTDDNNTGSESSSMSSEEGVMVGGAAMLRSRDIIENVSNASNLTTLVSAVTAADLVDALKTTDPITVFGPTDAAFGKLPAGTVESLLEPENKESLQNILQFHVVAGNYPVSELSDGQRLETLNGEELVVYKQGNVVTVNGARIETPDVFQKNGVAHVIDTVLLPPAEETLVGGAAMLRSRALPENIQNAPNLTTVVSAVVAADLVDTLASEGPFTVFGPDNSAFAKLPAGTLDTLLQPENKEQLAGVLTYHVVAGSYSVAQLYDGQELETVNGGTITIRKSGNTTQIVGGTNANVATIITPDVFQSNGVGHVIDTVLLPPASN